jgi:hypothetical protein
LFDALTFDVQRDLKHALPKNKSAATQWNDASVEQRVEILLESKIDFKYCYYLICYEHGPEKTPRTIMIDKSELMPLSGNEVVKRNYQIMQDKWLDNWQYKGKKTEKVLMLVQIETHSVESSPKDEKQLLGAPICYLTIDEQIIILDPAYNISLARKLNIDDFKEKAVEKNLRVLQPLRSIEMPETLCQFLSDDKKGLLQEFASLGEYSSIQPADYWKILSERARRVLWQEWKLSPKYVSNIDEKKLTDEDLFVRKAWCEIEEQQDCATRYMQKGTHWWEQDDKNRRAIYQLWSTEKAQKAVSSEESVRLKFEATPEPEVIPKLEITPRPEVTPKLEDTLAGQRFFPVLNSIETKASEPMEENQPDGLFFDID